MSKRKFEKTESREQRDEQKSDRLVRGVFIGLVVLAILSIIYFSTL